MGAGAYAPSASIVRPARVSPRTRSNVPLPVRDALARTASLEMGDSRAVASSREGDSGLLASANTDAASIGVSTDARADGLDSARPSNARRRSVALTRNGPYVVPAVTTYCPTEIVESGTAVSSEPGEALNSLDSRGDSLKLVEAADTWIQLPVSVLPLLTRPYAVVRYASSPGIVSTALEPPKPTQGPRLRRLRRVWFPRRARPEERIEVEENRNE